MSEVAGIVMWAVGVVAAAAVFVDLNGRPAWAWPGGPNSRKQFQTVLAVGALVGFCLWGIPTIALTVAYVLAIRPKVIAAQSGRAPDEVSPAPATGVGVPLPGAPAPVTGRPLPPLPPLPPPPQPSVHQRPVLPTPHPPQVAPGPPRSSGPVPSSARRTGSPALPIGSPAGVASRSSGKPEVPPSPWNGLVAPPPEVMPVSPVIEPAAIEVPSDPFAGWTFGAGRAAEVPDAEPPAPVPSPEVAEGKAPIGGWKPTAWRPSSAWKPSTRPYSAATDSHVRNGNDSRDDGRRDGRR